MKIKTSHRKLPIPSRNYDWMASKDDYAPGYPIGYGASEQQALDDLHNKMRAFEVTQ